MKYPVFHIDGALVLFVFLVFYNIHFGNLLHFNDLLLTNTHTGYCGDHVCVCLVSLTIWLPCWH